MRRRAHGATLRRGVRIALAALALSVGGPAVGVTATAYADMMDCNFNGSDQACGGSDGQSLGPEDPGPIVGRGSSSGVDVTSVGNVELIWNGM